MLFWIILAVSIAVFFFLLYLTVKYVRIVVNVFLNSTVSAPTQKHWESSGEVVRFLSLDGIEIKGVFIPHRKEGDNGGTIIFCHEVGAGLNSYEKYCSFLLDEGYNIFSFDFRGQHAEEGIPYNPTQWASETEFYDLMGAIAYVGGRSEVDLERIALFGVSRGATTCLCVLGRYPWVRACICDGAFSTKGTLASYMHRWGPIFFPRVLAEKCPALLILWLSWLARKVAQRKLGLKLLSVERTFWENRTVPVFIIHGKRDSYIDARHAKWLYDRIRSSKQIWIVEGARHNEAVRREPDEYKKRVSAFLKEYMT